MSTTVRSGTTTRVRSEAATRDWHQLPPADLIPWYEREQQQWRQAFSWETDANWRVVEAARLAGTLPGLVAYEAGTAVGWAFYLVHRGTLQIGALSAVSRTATHALCTTILDSPEAAATESAMAFVPDATPGLEAALRASGFGVQWFPYLTRTLTPRSKGAGSFTALEVDRLGAVAHVLSRAYPGADRRRPFAPTGTLDEWREYVARLVSGTGCGAWVPACSVVASQSGTDRIGGLVLTTAIAPGTAHVVQVAVDPECQGRGLGRRMLDEALSRLGAAGFDRVSLLVAEGNGPARRLYASLGFRPAGRFACATRMTRRLNPVGQPGPRARPVA